jgi:hypothetical protein
MPPPLIPSLRKGGGIFLRLMSIKAAVPVDRHVEKLPLAVRKPFPHPIHRFDDRPRAARLRRRSPDIPRRTAGRATDAAPPSGDRDHVRQKVKRMERKLQAARSLQKPRLMMAEDMF